MVPWRDRGVVEDSDEDDFEIPLSPKSEHGDPTIDNNLSRDSLVDNHKPKQDNIESGASGFTSQDCEHPDAPNRGQTEPSPALVAPSLGLPITARTSLEPGTPSKHARQYVQPPDEDVDELQDEPAYQQHRPKHARPVKPIEDLVPRSTEITPLRIPDNIFDVPSSASSGSSPKLPARSGQDDRGPSPNSTEQVETLRDISVKGVSIQASEANEAQDVITSNGRTFRRRNPIQVHPYMLENEQYRKSLQTRGLRPVQVAPNHAVAAESQYDDDHAEGGQTERGDPRDRKTQSPSRGPRSPGLHLLGHISSDDDDFPDLATAARTPLPDVQRAGVKRRKVLHLGHSPSPTDKSGPSLSEQSALKTSRTSSSQPKRIYRKKFRFPTGFTPAQLPTPLASSELSRPAIDIATASGSDMEPDSVPAEQRDDMAEVSPTISNKRARVATSSSEESSSGSSDGEQVRQAMKRIRGVLPASWLKFDKQAQRPKNNDKANLDHRGTLRNGVQDRGVARKVRRQHTAGLSEDDGSPLVTKEVVTIPEDSEEEDARERSPSPPYHSGALRFQVMSPMPEGDAGSDMEADWIDPMLSTKLKAQRPHHKKQKRQSKLTDASRQPHLALIRNKRPEQTERNHRLQQSSLSRQKATQRPRRSTAPKMSILDAPPLSPSFKIPSFLGVARRQARSRQDLGRQSPATKQISMCTQQDGAIVDEVISKWRHGHFPQKHSRPRPSMTRPLMPLSSRDLNRQEHFTRRAPDSSDVERQMSLTGTTNAPPKTGERPRVRQSRLQAVPMVRYPSGDDPFNTTPKSFDRQEGHRLQRGPVLDHRAAQRIGQLEELQAEHDARHPADVFRRGLLQMNAKHADGREKQSRPVDSAVERYLDGSGDEKSPKFTTDAITIQDPNPQVTASSTERRRRLRKRQPRWLDLQQIEAHKPSRIGDLPDELPTSSNDHAFDLPTTIAGLRPFGTQYTRDFGIAPLPVGVCFRQTTFVGSGEMSDLLSLSTKTLSDNRGSMTITYGNVTITLGQWTIEGSSLLKSLCTHCYEDIDQHLESQGDGDGAGGLSVLVDVAMMLRSLARYMVTKLSFLDTIDKRMCVLAITDVAADLAAKIARFGKLKHVTEEHEHRRALIQASTYLLSLCYAASSIGGDSVVSHESRSHLERVTVQVAVDLLENVLIGSAMQLQAFHDQLNLTRAREAGISIQESAIEAVVASYHLIKGMSTESLDFWKLINAAFCQPLPEVCSDVEPLERTWHTIFAILPLLEIDEHGVLRPGSRTSLLSSAPGLTIAAQKLISLTFQLSSMAAKPPTLNAYIRATLQRCFVMLRTWGWRQCEALLGTVFDFFAHHGLHMLQNEACASSCLFLENLDAEELPLVDSSDHSFHIFLKTLTVGIKQMRDVYPEKKIKNLTWRFVPNHGRSHRKEDDLKHEDLDALRNHHDLLTVLSYAPPASARPKLTLIRNLVDFRTSHIELCRLNIRAWVNLVRYQLSCRESHSFASDFGAWFKDMLNGCLFQHKSAQIEAEMFRASAITAGSNFISQDLLDATVAANQRNVESMLGSLLGSYAGVLRQASNSGAIDALFQQASPASVFDLFTPNLKRIHTVLGHALEVYEAVVVSRNKQRIQMKQAYGTDESQDYGDWPSEDEDVVARNAHQGSNVDETVVHDLHAFLSNLCGVDGFQDETLLARTIDVYVPAIAALVNTGGKQWTTYLDEHFSRSWNSLRDTDQRQLFSAYYFATILENDIQSFQDATSTFMSAWLTSLVERESMLRYQHRLTSALLNACPDHPLLQNLPFVRDSNGRFDISLVDIRSRRLSLISSILSNIRLNYEDSFLGTKPDSRSETCEKHVAALRALTAAMKRNYQETQTGTTTRGAYIDFVQTIVQFLQEYTTDILPIDKFFIDSSDFPLPTADPLYVMGRLRSYQLHASDLSTQKKLAVFVQTTAERAAAEQQQDYLVSQLRKSVEGDASLPSVCASQPSLRTLLMQAIFPAYIEASLHQPCGGLIARPILETLSHVMDGMLGSLNLADWAALETAVHSIICILTAVSNSLDLYVESRGAYYEPETSRTMELMYRMVTAACPCLDFAARSGIDISAATHTLTTLANMGPKLPTIAMDRLKTLIRHSIHDADARCARLPAAPSCFAQTLAFTTREINFALEKHWERPDWRNDRTQGRLVDGPLREQGGEDRWGHGTGAYRVLRVGSWRNVFVDLTIWDTKKAVESYARKASREYREVVNRMKVLRELVGADEHVNRRSIWDADEDEEMPEKFWPDVLEDCFV